jgi:DNA modification methylase
MKVEIGDATLYCGDCLAVLRTLPESSVDAVVTDPPYGLSFMGKRWDYDVPEQAVWAECLRVLKPGGHLLAFAGTRTQHRMAVRIEDAGFEIRDMIAWVYGSGFPKSLDVSKAIDRAAGAEREVVGIVKKTAQRVKRLQRRTAANTVGRGQNNNGHHRPRHPRSPAMARLGHGSKARPGADHHGPQAAL